VLHEIFPKEYNVEYKEYTPNPSDTVFIFDNDNVYCRQEENKLLFPQVCDFSDIDSHDLRYLFSIDTERYFMPDVCSKILPPQEYQSKEWGIFVTSAEPRHQVFAATTARELYQWYISRRFCGSCGHATVHGEKERSCVCPKCGLVEYPKISPVVIVAVTDGDNLLVTRYKNRPYRRYALVAGFVEVGEAFEDAVRREVYEETGVRVKNVRYYKSQPWGFTSTLLAGYYCELDGDPQITFDENELAEAIWLARGDIPPAESDVALTSEMMEMFRTGQCC